MDLYINEQVTSLPDADPQKCGTAEHAPLQSALILYLEVDAVVTASLDPNDALLLPAGRDITRAFCAEHPAGFQNSALRR